VTYSIVARDAATGEMGVAGQSHYLGLGAVVPWAEPGVGVVATQAFVEPAYGPLGLDLLRGGRSATAALRALVAADAEADRRQVAVLDGAGEVAVHTGEGCIADACEATGDGVSAQANMVATPTLARTMVDTFLGSDGALADRLLAALDAAEAEGGDLRGRQSASLTVVSGERLAARWTRRYDLRVDDHADPLGELRRLLTLSRAYERLDELEHAVEDGEIDRAMSLVDGVLDDGADNPEFPFWVAVVLATAGRIDEARGLIAPVLATGDGWVRVLRGLSAVGRLDPDIVERLTARGGDPTGHAEPR